MKMMLRLGETVMAYANVEDKRAYQRRHYELNKDKYKATAKSENQSQADTR